MLFIADVVSYHFIFPTGLSFESCSSLFSYFFKSNATCN